MQEGVRRVAVIPHRIKDQPWGLRLKEELERCLVDHPEIALEFTDPEGSAVAQLRLLEAVVRDRVDAVIVAPIDPPLIRAELQRLADARVPVIALDCELDDPTLYRSMIVSDNRTFGRKMGEFFVEVTGGVGEVVEICGIPTTSGARHRSEGFRQALAGHPGLRIAETITGDWLYSHAREGMTRLLHRLAHVDCVFAQNDEMARGAWDAAEQAGRADEMLIAGIDALRGENGIQLVMQGKLAATLLNPLPSRAAAAALLAVLAGEPCLPETLLQTSMLRSQERIRAWQEQRRRAAG